MYDGASAVMGKAGMSRALEEARPVLVGFAGRECARTMDASLLRLGTYVLAGGGPVSTFPGTALRKTMVMAWEKGFLAPLTRSGNDLHVAVALAVPEWERLRPSSVPEVLEGLGKVGDLSPDLEALGAFLARATAFATHACRVIDVTGRVEGTLLTFGNVPGWQADLARAVSEGTGLADGYPRHRLLPQADGSVAALPERRRDDVAWLGRLARSEMGRVHVGVGPKHGYSYEDAALAGFEFAEGTARGLMSATSRA